MGSKVPSRKSFTESERIGRSLLESEPAESCGASVKEDRNPDGKRLDRAAGGDHVAGGEPSTRRAAK